MRSKLVLVLVAFTLVAAACGGDDDDTAAPSTLSTTTVPASGLAAARELWESQGLTSYTFEFERRCFCVPAHYQVTVTDGVVTGAEPLSPESPATPDPPLETIDGLFDELERAEAEATGPVEVTYDPVNGVPTDAFIDWMLDAIDDENGWTIANLQPA